MVIDHNHLRRKETAEQKKTAGTGDYGYNSVGKDTFHKHIPDLIHWVAIQCQTKI
jgi:hypothetical protein